MKEKGHVLMGISILIAFFLSACMNRPDRLTKNMVTPTPSQTPRQQSIQEMLIVVDAIEAYYQDFSDYPDSLDALIPDYLAEQPFTNEGFEITYELGKAYIYIVAFRPAPYQYCAFVKADNNWECGF